MSAETNQSLDQVMVEDNTKTTAERPLFSPILPKRNEEIDMEKDFNTTEIKTESLDSQGNEDNPKAQVTDVTAQCDSPENAEKIQEAPTITAGDHHEFLAPNPVEIKEEPFSEENNVIDYGMPIAKTPLRVDDTLDNLTFDMETTSTLPVSTASADNNMELGENPTKTALDAYLDGIETPLAPVKPRLRVKPEFTLQNEALRMFPSEQISLNNDKESMNCEISPPPPPPLISSNSSANFVVEGVSTPRLSLIAINRVRVKTELSVNPSTSQYHNEDTSSVPQMVDETQEKEAGEIFSSNSEDVSDAESIPPDFFDDLLEDKSKSRIEEAENYENEEKYSDKIKELERLRKEKEIMKRNSKERHKNRKKQKKSKKKSRKRSRSRSLSPGRKTRDSAEEDLRNFSNHEKKRTRRSPLSREMPTSSIFVNKELMEDDLRMTPGFKVKTEFPSTDLNNFANGICEILNDIRELVDFNINNFFFNAGGQSIMENIEEVVEVLTPKQRREKGY